jgi:SAM-dependent methyltransferase
MHGTGDASAWIRRWSHLVPAGGAVLDVACGAGRHLRWFAGRGHPVIGIDRDPQALAACAGTGRLVQADIEGGPWPLAGERFAAVVVTNYLWRPLWPALLDSLAPGGVLLYETFNVDHAAIGKPSRLDFLLRHGELLQLAAGLHVVAYEAGELPAPQRRVQRIVALRPPLADGWAPGALPLESPLPGTAT